MKRLREGRIRDVAFVLIEFSRREQALGRHRLAELADDGGLADTAMARHQNEFSPSSCGDAVERCNKSVYLRLASIELFRDQKSVRHIARADGEGVNSLVRLPRSQACPQIRFEARGGLKPILWRLCEQLQDDGLDRAGNPVDPLAWRRRRAGNVAMDPFQRIGCRERERSGDRLVKGDAASVEIATRINRPVHAAGLLGRHVSQRSRDCFGRSRRLAWEVRRDAETRQPDRPGRVVDEDIGWLDIFVDEASPVESRQRSRQADGEAQKRSDLPRLPQEPQQGLSAGILAQQRKPTVVSHEPQRPSCPARVELVPQLESVLQARDGCRRRRGG